MSVLTWIEKTLVLLLLFYLHGTSSQNCNVSSFQLQANFDYTKYYGTWYSLGWLPMYYLSKSDYYEDYSQTTGMAGTNSLDVTVTGRKPNSTKCDLVKPAYNFDPTNPAKTWYTDTTNGANRRVDLWIIATDYQTYSYMYGCDQLNTNGTCDNSHVFFQTKNLSLAKNVPESLRAIGRNLSQTVCLNYDQQFINAIYTADGCPVPEGKSTGDNSNINTASLGVLLLAWILTKVSADC